MKGAASMLKVRTVVIACLLAMTVYGIAETIHPKSMPSDGSDPMPICRKKRCF